MSMSWMQDMFATYPVCRSGNFACQGSLEARPHSAFIWTTQVSLSPFVQMLEVLRKDALCSVPQSQWRAHQRSAFRCCLCVWERQTECEVGCHAGFDLCHCGSAGGGKQMQTDLNRCKQQLLHTITANMEWSNGVIPCLTSRGRWRQS